MLICISIGLLQDIGRGAARAGQYPGGVAEGQDESGDTQEEAHRRTHEEPEHGEWGFVCMMENANGGANESVEVYK